MSQTPAEENSSDKEKEDLLCREKLPSEDIFGKESLPPNEENETASLINTSGERLPPTTSSQPTPPSPQPSPSSQAKQTSSLSTNIEGEQLCKFKFLKKQFD